jgi:hypothetical protein
LDALKSSNGLIVLVLPAASPEEHLSSLDDQVSLADLILPATHESLALHGCEQDL